MAAAPPPLAVPKRRRSSRVATAAAVAAAAAADESEKEEEDVPKRKRTRMRAPSPHSETKAAAAAKTKPRKRRTSKKKKKPAAAAAADDDDDDAVAPPPPPPRAVIPAIPKPIRSQETIRANTLRIHTMMATTNDDIETIARRSGLHWVVKCSHHKPYNVLMSDPLSFLIYQFLNMRDHYAFQLVSVYSFRNGFSERSWPRFAPMADRYWEICEDTVEGEPNHEKIVRTAVRSIADKKDQVPPHNESMWPRLMDIYESSGDPSTNDGATVERDPRDRFRDGRTIVVLDKDDFELSVVYEPVAAKKAAAQRYIAESCHLRDIGLMKKMGPEVTVNIDDEHHHPSGKFTISVEDGSGGSQTETRSATALYNVMLKGMHHQTPEESTFWNAIPFKAPDVVPGSGGGAWVENRNPRAPHQLQHALKGVPTMQYKTILALWSNRSTFSVRIELPERKGWCEMEIHDRRVVAVAWRIRWRYYDASCIELDDKHIHWTARQDGVSMDLSRDIQHFLLLAHFFDVGKPCPLIKSDGTNNYVMVKVADDKSMRHAAGATAEQYRAWWEDDELHAPNRRLPLIGELLLGTRLPKDFKFRWDGTGVSEVYSEMKTHHDLLRGLRYQVAHQYTGVVSVPPLLGEMIASVKLMYPGHERMFTHNHTIRHGGEGSMSFFINDYYYRACVCFYPQSWLVQQ